MSAEHAISERYATGVAAPRPSEAPGVERHITALPDAPARSRRPRLAHVLVPIAGVGVIVAAQLGLGAALSQGAYQVAALESQQQELGWTKDDLGEEVQAISSPQYIAANAEALGMVASGSTAYLRLSDQAVLGDVGAATGDSAVPFGPAALVANEALDGAAVAGDPDRPLPGQASEPDPGSAPADLSLSDGLPSPSTR